MRVVGFGRSVDTQKAKICCLTNKLTMSKATKRKHVANEVLHEYVLPTEQQEIVKILIGRGNNLHEVVTASGEHFLASMPTKFRKNIWIKRGDYVIVEPIEEGDKVKAEIVTILYKDQIKYIKKEGQWPKEFIENDDAAVNDTSYRDNNTAIESNSELNSESECESDSDIFVNTNHPHVCISEDSDDTSESEEND